MLSYHHFQTRSIDLFCISHSGFASDYPFNYGYMKEDCYDRYLLLKDQDRLNRSIILNQLLILMHCLLIAHPFVPNKWVSDNWKYCSNKEK